MTEHFTGQEETITFDERPVIRLVGASVPQELSGRYFLTVGYPVDEPDKRSVAISHLHRQEAELHLPLTDFE